MMLLLQELLKNSKRSDRELAKILGVSQPTLTRMRKRLERDSYILDYTAIPNLTKLGFEIIAVTFFDVDGLDSKAAELETVFNERAHKVLTHSSRIVLATIGEGLHGANYMMISVHRDFTDYTDFISDFRSQSLTQCREIDSFLVSLKTKMPKPFSFRNLEITSQAQP